MTETYIPVWTWRDAIRRSKATPAAKLICYTLANYISEVGEGKWPTVEQLVEDTGMVERSITTHLKSAVEHGLLSIARKTGKDGRMKAYEYQPRFPNRARLPRPNEIKVDGFQAQDLPLDRPGANSAGGDQAQNLRLNKDGRVITSGDTPLPPKGGQRAVRTTLPPGWKLPDDWRQWALDHSPQHAHLLPIEEANFRDHWHGKGGRMIDWRATWQVWWRRECKRPAMRSAAVPQSKREADLEGMRRAKAILDAMPASNAEAA